MKLLHELVIPKILSQWKTVATCLNYTEERIKQLGKAETDSYQCCADLLRDWLSSYHETNPCSWDSLFVALKKNQQLISVALKIEKEFFSLTKSVQLFSWFM